MSEKLPGPDFDGKNYARPNDQWICGRACEGKPCRLGPDKKGRCQATAECAPVLEKKPGETKGRWRCTRPTPCESGPLPDGSCCRPTPKCSPRRSLRALRGRVTFAVVIATCAALLIMLGGPWRGNFINPGPLSDPHSSSAFAKLHGGTNQSLSTCTACHSAGNSGPAGLGRAALQASPAPWQLEELATTRFAASTTIDTACARCHTRHSFHQANAPRDVSCSYCHAEHRGAGRIPLPTDVHCAVCHSDPHLMAAAAKIQRPPAKGDKLLPRPAEGFTQVINSFATNHPEFRSRTNRDPNTLKFGHHLHLTSATIPKLPGGRPLDCRFCHEPDATGAYLRPVSFEQNCRVCHSLQFDANTPELQLPHGDPAFVSAFLRSLPKQYADVAGRLGVSGEQQKEFVTQKLQQLESKISSGEEFERRIFLTDAMRGPTAEVGTVSGPERALYAGCAYCHEVKSVTRKAEITKPLVIERWLTRAKFNHSKHASLACTHCHAAEQSKVTADVILPTKDSCVTCHSPSGGVVDSCVTCHTYHRTAN